LDSVVDFEFKNHMALMVQKSYNSEQIKKIPKDKIQPFMKNYKSVSWALLMGAWFFDFIGALMKRVKQKDYAISTAAREAYHEKLGPHHNWLLRSAASIGISACVSRTSLIDSIIKEQSMVQGKRFTEENCYELFEIMATKAEKIGTHIWSLYAKHNVDRIDD